MTKLYNLEYLEEISGGDQDFINDMLNDFITITPGVISQIESYISSQNWMELYKTLHKFIPSFEYVGGNDVKVELRNIENYAKTQTNTDQIPYLFQGVKGFCLDILEEIKTDFKIN